MSFSTPDRDLELHTDCDNLSKIVQVSPIDSADVCCLQKTSIVDKLLDDRKNEFKLPTLKTKKSSCVLTSEENLKIVREKEMKKKKEEKEKAQRRALREEKKKEREMIQLQQKVNTSKKGICKKREVHMYLEADWLHIPHSKKFCLTLC